MTGSSFRFLNQFGLQALVLYLSTLHSAEPTPAALDRRLNDQSAMLRRGIVLFVVVQRVTRGDARAALI